MLDELKQQVYEANMELPAKGLVLIHGEMSVGLTENVVCLSLSQVVLTMKN